MMAEDTNLSFENLCGQDNWAIWSDAMETYLEAINCWKIMKRQEARPIAPEQTEESTAAEKKEHERKKEKQENWDSRAARNKT